MSGQERSHHGTLRALPLFGNGSCTIVGGRRRRSSLIDPRTELVSAYSPYRRMNGGKAMRRIIARAAFRSVRCNESRLFFCSKAKFLRLIPGSRVVIARAHRVAV